MDGAIRTALKNNKTVVELLDYGDIKGKVATIEEAIAKAVSDHLRGNNPRSDPRVVDRRQGGVLG